MNLTNDIDTPAVALPPAAHVRLGPEHGIAFFEVGLQLYVMSGRVPGEEEDDTYSLCARDEVHAVERFYDLMGQACGGYAEMQRICLGWGEKYPYITSTTHVGEILP